MIFSFLIPFLHKYQFLFKMLLIFSILCEKMAFVYLLCDSGEENLYKIGVTRGKLEKRIKQLQTGNGNEINLIRFHATNYPFYIEKLLHLKFNGKCVKNEWFKLNDNDVLDFNETCEKLEKNIDALKENPFIKI